MITRRSLETIIAATNSIHRRTQLRVMSAVAPEKASGASTAAIRIIIFRVIIAAQTMTDAHRITMAKISASAGFWTDASCAKASLSPTP